MKGVILEERIEQEFHHNLETARSEQETVRKLSGLRVEGAEVEQEVSVEVDCR